MKLKCINRQTLLVIAYTFLFYNSTNAQKSDKPPIDTSTYGKWYTLGYHEISNDGRYVLYVINNCPINMDKLVIQDCQSNWKTEVLNVTHDGMQFVNNHFAIFKCTGDSLGILRLGTNDIRYILQVKNYKAVFDGSKEWLAIQVAEPENQLILMDLSSGRMKNISSVLDFAFNPQGNKLFLTTQTKTGDGFNYILQFFDLKGNKEVVIWEGIKPMNVCFDSSSTQIAFNISDDENIKLNSICYYKKGMNRAMILIDKKSLGIDSQFSITGRRLLFSKNGEKIFFSVEKKLRLDLNESESVVDVWHYKDKYPRSSKDALFFFSNDKKTIFTAVVDINTKKVIALENKEIVMYSERGNNYVLCYQKSCPNSYYIKECRPSYYLKSLNDGTQKLVNERSLISYISLSPDEKYIIWFDMDSLCYFSYEIASGITRNISNSIPQHIYDDKAKAIGRVIDFGVAGWLTFDDAVIIYDRYDLWKVFANGQKKPINLTNDFGRRHQIVFGLLSSLESINTKAGKSNTVILLAAFNRENKKNGFWKIDLSKQLDPQLLTMDPYSYFIPVANNYVPRIGITGFVGYASADRPMKATNANRWLVTRMNAEEAPNLFVTDNFKSFQRISNSQPQKDYNWMSAKLENWAISDEQTGQGILYKPENFDSTKKYPVIFTYYEKRSDELNEFLKPDFVKSRLNIATYVSNGYIVFVPDLYFIQGHNGKSALNCILTAVNHLSKYTWVDTTKLALQGHSFAGWVTNYLITHTKLFAAACEAAGVSDQVSAYGQLIFESNLNRQAIYEIDGQGSPYGIGITPWTKPELYIENSPIFFIDNISTPLLMMHGTSDRAVPFEQALEMFMGMKRAGKRAWLLRYPGAGHSLGDKDAKDYTIKMSQFFDHYLKGTPAPTWMTNAVGNYNKE